MELTMNEGHPVEVEVGGRRYARHAIHTRFVEIGESYLDLIREYVLPVWQPGDLLSSSEKVVALCQGRVVYEEDVKPGLLARFLAPFASGTPDAFGVKHPAKMQFAINECGAARVLWAAICAGGVPRRASRWVAEGRIRSVRVRPSFLIGAVPCTFRGRALRASLGARAGLTAPDAPGGVAGGAAVDLAAEVPPRLRGEDAAGFGQRAL